MGVRFFHEREDVAEGELVVLGDGLLAGGGVGLGDVGEAAPLPALAVVYVVVCRLLCIT